MTVKVDPRRKARYEALARTLSAASSKEASGFDAYWEAVGSVLDGELYVEAGYDTAAAWIAAVVRQPARTVRRMVRVARFASPEEEKRYGTAVLDAALSYLEAKLGAPVQGRLPVKFEALRVPVERKGAARSLPLEKVTLAELRKATAKLARAGTSKARGAARTRSESAVSEALHRVKMLEECTVQVRDGKLWLGAVPLYALEALGRALAALELPAEAAATKPAAKRKHR